MTPPLQPMTLLERVERLENELAKQTEHSPERLRDALRLFDSVLELTRDTLAVVRDHSHRIARLENRTDAD